MKPGLKSGGKTDRSGTERNREDATTPDGSGHASSVTPPLAALSRLTLSGGGWRTATHRGFVADGALDHVLMQLPIQVDDGIADAAVDDGHAAGVGAGDGRVGRGQFRCGRARRRRRRRRKHM